MATNKIYGDLEVRGGLILKNYQFPLADGSNGQVLSTDGAGTVIWEDAASGGTSGGTSPAGSNTQIQFNDSGSFGANTGFTFDTTNQTLFTESNVSGTSVNFYNGLSNFDVGFGSTEAIGTTMLYNTDPIGSASGLTMFTMGDLTDVFGADNSYLLGFINVSGNTNSFINGSPEGTRIMYTPSDGGGRPNSIEVGYGGITNEILSGKTFEVQGASSNTLLNVNDSGTTFHSTYTFPTTDGSLGQVLQTDGGGTVSWANPYIGGMFAQTGDSATVSATTTETSIVGDGVGSLSVPADSFRIGDSFHAKIGGYISSQNNAELTMRIKADGSTLTTLGPIVLPTMSNQFWELEVDFTMRVTGATGSIKTNGQFVYVQNSGNNYNGYGFNTDSSIDTTVLNELGITVEWGTTDVSNAIMSDLFYLKKCY